MEKLPLKAAIGKYLHASQNAPLSPYMIDTEGMMYQDLPPEHFADGCFEIKGERFAAWGYGSYLIEPEGELVISDYHYDSSG